MKKLMTTGLFVFLLNACASSIPLMATRDKVAVNLEPLLKLETRIGFVQNTAAALDSAGKISDGVGAKLKSHYDIYYVYYLSANIFLAQDNMASYKKAVEQAASEIDTLEGILKKIFEGLEIHPPFPTEPSPKLIL